ncbi:MAG: hypothetical protein R2991_10450 [Thermoanaerobaculia bacterium]
MNDVTRPIAAAALCAGLALGAAAALRGDEPFTPHATQPPLDQVLITPETCAFCHSGYDAVHNIEPWDTWAGSMMANAARDPVFWAALDVANHDIPGVGEYCLRCHAPKAWLENRANADPKGGVGDADGCNLSGFVDDPTMGMNDFSSVQCHFCHRAMVNDSPPPGEASVYTENAELWIDDLDSCEHGGDPEPCRRGPYDYSAGGNPAPHNWAYSPYHTASTLCAACHNVTSPATTLIDEQGNDTMLPYPIERTHKEWTQSDFADSGSGVAAECQTCHMPSDPGPMAYACSLFSNDHSGELPIHQFAGGNTWVPEILRQKYPGLDRDAEFQATAAWARQKLEEQAATIELSLPEGVAPGGTLHARVRVTNLGGHKLPTGYTEGRRMWLHVEARDATDTLLWESGGYDSSTGVLTQDAQVKVYQTLRGTWDTGSGSCVHTNGGGAEIFHFVLNDCIVVDNRIPPLGFTGGSDPETRPVAYTYPEASPGVLVNYDDTEYAVPIPVDATSPVTVRATLRYQTASKEYVDFLLEQAQTHDFPDDCLSRSSAATALLPPVGQRSRGEILHHFWSDADPALAKSPPVDMVQAEGDTAVTTDIFEDGFESGDTTAWSNTVG